MLKNILFVALLLLLSGVVWYAGTQFPDPLITRAFHTILALSFIHLIFNLFLGELAASKIKDDKTRFSFRKAVSLIYSVILVASLIAIWIENPEALLVAYGLIAAGIAISLQDLFRNFAGGMVLFFTRPYSIGDRIEINSKFGDVIDMGLLYTTLMETRLWVGGDQATGRLTIMPNSLVLSSPVHNYTKDHNFIWDEIVVPISYTSDWKSAESKILAVVRRETKQTTERAEKQLAKIRQKYYVPKRAVEPTVFIQMTDNWITFYVRYVTEARERRRVNDHLSRLILDEIQKSKEIKIASTTLDIVGFPERGRKG